MGEPIIIRGLKQNNLKNISLDIPKNKIVVFTGVSGSGKSSIVFDTIAAESQRQMNETYSAWVRGRLPKYEKPNVEIIDNLNPSVVIDQSRLGGNARSTVCTFLGFFDEIRKVFATETNADRGLFTFNGKGACPHCKGRGMITTELVFMEPVTTVCEYCNGTRYSDEALQYTVKGKTIVDVLNMSVEEAVPFFADNKKISSMLSALMEVGLSYISLGQPLSTFSGGERQRVKLAQNIKKKGNIYILDEPTTGLHIADIEKVVNILESFVDRGNTVIVIEHNTDVMKLADYIIDIGPEGGTKGGEVVFTGTPREMIENGETITARYLRKCVR